MRADANDNENSFQCGRLIDSPVSDLPSQRLAIENPAPGQACKVNRAEAAVQDYLLNGMANGRGMHQAVAGELGGENEIRDLGAAVDDRLAARGTASAPHGG